MLAYLDALIAALTVRDAAEVERLLAHPLARILSDVARGEAQAFGRGECDPLAAPLRVMQLRHQTAELLRDAPVIADRPEDAATETGREPARTGPAPTAQVPRRAARQVQMELPLSA